MDRKATLAKGGSLNLFLAPARLTLAGDSARVDNLLDYLIASAIRPRATNAYTYSSTHTARWRYVRQLSWMESWCNVDEIMLLRYYVTTVYTGAPARSSWKRKSAYVWRDFMHYTFYICYICFIHFSLFRRKNGGKIYSSHARSPLTPPPHQTRFAFVLYNGGLLQC